MIEYAASSMRWQRASAVMASGAVLAGLSIGTAAAEPAPPPPPTSTPAPFTTPNTDSCPNQSVPPPAVDLSEVPEPGETTPKPVPVPSQPIGGERMGECGVVLPENAPPLPAHIAATGWVLADVDTGEVLAAKDPHGRYRPASTIKILLALVALDELDLTKTVTATAEDAAIEGSAVGIGPNGQYTNMQLMQGLVMASGNDAAHLLARQLGGSDETVEKMNALAEELGALDTRTATPSGLDGPGMSSSPFDLALIFHEAMKNPTFAKLISTEVVEFPGYPKNPAIPVDPSVPGEQDKPAFALGNDNRLLYNYPGAFGGKTGYTDDARHTYVGGAERDGRRLMVTLMGGEAKPLRPWEQAAHLLDYGFALDADAVGSLLEHPDEASADDAALLAAPPGATDRPGGPVMASGSDSPNSSLAVRAGVGVIGTGVVIGLLGWARRLNRGRR